MLSSFSVVMSAESPWIFLGYSKAAMVSFYNRFAWVKREGPRITCVTLKSSENVAVSQFLARKKRNPVCGPADHVFIAEDEGGIKEI